MYKHEKTHRPRPDDEYRKPRRVTNFEKKREEVEYHPILQTFTSTQREADAKRFETAAQTGTLNKARDKQLATESTFNILTMEDKRKGLDVMNKATVTALAAPFNPHAERPTFRHPLDSCYAFNIISNLSLSDHHHTNPSLRPSREAGAREPKPRLQHVSGMPRDYNILSNQYREEHDEKIKLEGEVLRRTAAKKYWDTHDYDPLIGRYVDPSKEEAYEQHNKKEMARQPLKQFNRLPPSLQRGEGFIYDITTHGIKNKDLYDRKQAAEQAWFDSHAAKWIRDEEIRDISAARQQYEDRRTINRASHERYMEKYQYGYDIVDQRDFR
ncbi:MAG: hypothetical protein SGPRY_008625 [Prymnesium sp.]